MIQEVVINVPVKISFYGDQLPKDVTMEKVAENVAYSLNRYDDGRGHIAVESFVGLLYSTIYSSVYNTLIKVLGSRIKNRMVKVSKTCSSSVVSLVVQKRLKKNFDIHDFAIRVEEITVKES